MNSLALRWQVHRRREVLRRDAADRFDAACLALDFARSLFSGFPSDVSAEGVRNAEDSLIDATAVYTEWHLEAA